MATLKIETPNCPECNSPARGTLEKLRACAQFQSDAGGGLEYCGFTEVWWEEQETNRDREGRVELVCDNRHRWYSKMEEIPMQADRMDASNGRDTQP